MSLYALALPQRGPAWGLPGLPVRNLPFPARFLLPLGPRQQELARRRQRYQSWARFEEPQQIEGLGNFLKKVRNAVRRVTVAPVKLLHRKTGEKFERALKKIDDKVDKVTDKLDNFVHKNRKWLIIAAAIAITIYSLGSGSTIAAKMLAGLSKLKTVALAKGKALVTWGAVKKKAATMAISKLLQGKKFGELNTQEVSAMAEVNGASGEQIIPPEVMALMQPTGESVPEFVAAERPSAAGFPGSPEPGAESQAGLPGWVVPAGVGALALFLLTQ